ncbi:unnamed protein product [Alternaria alternata]
MKDEANSLQANETWKLVELPPGRKVIQENEFEKDKSRLFTEMTGKASTENSEGRSVPHDETSLKLMKPVESEL